MTERQVRITLGVLLFLVSGCELGLPAGSEPHRETNRIDMNDQPKLKPQRADLLGEDPTGMLAPPAGTLAIGERPYPFAQDQAELAGQTLKNPLSPTPEVLAKGKWTYEQVCIVCHGPLGAGDGHLTKLFPKPPSLMTQRVRDWPDGQIFHRPMRGQDSMPSHSGQLEAEEIWAVTLYLRELQKGQPVAPPPEPAQAPAPTEGAPAAPESPAPTPDQPTPAQPTEGDEIK